MEKIINWSAKLSLFIASVSAIALALQGPGYQAGWWGLGFSFFKVFKIVVYTGGIAAVLGLIGVLGAKVGSRKSLIMSLIGLLLGISTAAVPLQMRKIGQSVPPIHDITTNIVNPPEFIAIAPLRAEAPNPISYDPEVSKQQVTAFPDIKTMQITSSRKEVFIASKNVLTSMNLELVNADEAAGLLEATDTSTWFGFKDDVVVRISADAKYTLVDIRSKSRVGRSDLGMNAKRIRTFRTELLKQLDR